jgi:hypothetical protein
LKRCCAKLEILSYKKSTFDDCFVIAPKDENKISKCLPDWKLIQLKFGD